MSSFFHIKNKYIISFNHSDLIKKNIESTLNECKLNQKSKVQIHLEEAKDITMKNLMILVSFVIHAKKIGAKVHFYFSKELNQLLEEANLYKLFI